MSIYTCIIILLHTYIFLISPVNSTDAMPCCVALSPDPIHSPRVPRLRLVAISCCLSALPCSALLCSALDWRMRSSPFTWKRCVKAMATTMPINHMPGRQAGSPDSERSIEFWHRRS